MFRKFLITSAFLAVPFLAGCDSVGQSEDVSLFVEKCQGNGGTKAACKCLKDKLIEALEPDQFAAVEMAFSAESGLDLDAWDGFSEVDKALLSLNWYDASDACRDAE